MSDVNPWEPVGWGRGDEEDVRLAVENDFAVIVTLANGQRIIVRALSEERKAARAFERRVAKAMEANR